MLAIRLIDGQGGLLRAPETIFRADEAGLAEFGFNVPNAALVAALTDALVREPGVTVIPGSVADLTAFDSGVLIRQQDGSQILAALVVGADGRQLHEPERSRRLVAKPGTIRRRLSVHIRPWPLPPGHLDEFPRPTAR